MKNYLIVLLSLGLGALSWVFLEEIWELERELAMTMVRVDTIYKPPQPTFIEAFRLKCYWVPREKNDS